MVGRYRGGPRGACVAIARRGSARVRWWWAGVAVTLLVGAPAAAQERRGEIVGRVVESATGRAVPGAAVRLAGAAIEAAADSAGAFRLRDVPVGVVAIDAWAPGYEPVRVTDVVVSTARPALVTVRLTSAVIALEELVVRPSAFLPAAEAPVSTHVLRSEEIRRAPGGWEDPVRAVSMLPGVAPMAVHSNMLVVRGGAPFENLFVVDGLEVSDISHFAAQGSSGGFTSLLELELVDDVEFSAGGFGAAHGDRVGSVTAIALREGLAERHAGSVNLSLTGIGGIAEGPVGRGSYVIGARRSYMDLVLDWSGESFYTRYAHVNAKVTQRLGARDALSWIFVGALDDFGFNVETPDDLYENAFLATNLDQYFSGLTWSHTRGRSRFVLTAGRTARAFDTFENDTLGASVFTNRSREAENSLRAAYTRALARGTLEVGAVAKLHDPLRYDISLDGRHRPDDAGVPRPLAVDTSFDALRFGSWAEATVRWTRRLSTRIGARLDYHGDPDETPTFAPRLAATLELDRRTSLNVAAGRYWQAPSFIWLVGDSSNGERLRPFRVDQGVLGVQHLIGSEMKLQLEAYYRRYRDYPARVWHPEAVVAPSNFETVTADVPAGLEPLTAAGSGRAYGAELFLHKRLGEVPVYGIASLSAGRAELAGTDGRLRRSTYDAPITMNVALGWKPGPAWDFGLRFRAASGAPKTPFIASGPLAGRRDLSRLNEDGRMPAFHALDVRIDRSWAVRGARVTTYLDIQDLYNRDNPIGHYWDWREARPTYETAIGTFPSIGVNVAF